MDTAFILTAIFVACVLLFGAFLLFVRAENIERNVLVGGLTLLFGLIAGGILTYDARLNFPYGTATMVTVAILSVLGFAAGRLIDWYLGPMRHSADSRQATLGAELAD